MTEKISLAMLNTPLSPTWCHGCGNFGIWTALKMALTKLDVPLQDICIVYGIGCHGHMCTLIDAYGFEGLHGRPIPVAEGIKIANSKLKVIVIAGDGDTYGEGMNHFLTGIRGNHDITVIVHDNGVYGLTTGQASPTSEKGFKTKSTPGGVIEVPVNPIALALVSGCGFVARAFSGNVKHLSSLIVDAVAHPGFSFVDVFQNCVSFNHKNTFDWYNERVYILQDAGHDVSDKMLAIERSFQADKLPIGLFYRDARESYEDDIPGIKETPLVGQDLDRDLSAIFSRYM